MKLDELNNDIIESGLKKTYISYKMGCSRQHLYQLLKGDTEWTRPEIEAISDILKYSKKRTLYIFF